VTEQPKPQLFDEPMARSPDDPIFEITRSQDHPINLRYDNQHDLFRSILKIEEQFAT
jgi:hypothetical protein